MQPNRLTGVYDSTDTTRKAVFTWDDLSRRREHLNEVLTSTARYGFDGFNEYVNKCHEAGVETSVEGIAQGAKNRENI